MPSLQPLPPPLSRTQDPAAEVRKIADRLPKRLIARPAERLMPAPVGLSPGRSETFTATPGLSALISSLPSRRRPARFIVWFWFFLSVVLPVGTGTAYYGFIAANQYVSEFRFAVREADFGTAGGQSGASVASGLSSVFGSLSGGMDLLDNFTITNYFLTTDAVVNLDRKVNLRKMFSRATGDWWARLSPTASREALVSYWRNMIYTTYDPATGLAMFRIHAFSAQDAYRIATTMLTMADQKVNQIGEQMRTDAIRFARQEVTRAQQDLHKVQTQMMALRDKSGVIDPTNSLVQSNIQLLTSLRAGIAQLETQRAATVAQLHDRSAPQVQTLQSQIKAARKQLGLVTAEVNKAAAGNGNLSSVVGQYEVLNLDQQTAEQILAATVTNLQAAYSYADAKHVYLAPYASPQLAMTPQYPQRYLDIGLLSLVSLMIFGIGALIISSILDHGH